MTTSDTATVQLVVVAQGGDDEALDRLVAEHLPLVYGIVARALGGHADVDDVVQDTFVRAVRELPRLRRPESFRSWLVAITVRQVASHHRRRRTALDTLAPLPEADAVPADDDVEGDVVGRLHLAQQRRELLAATRWLDDGARTLLALWVQEEAGGLTRSEVADAAGASGAHLRVRRQRVRQQLVVARDVVAALEATPRCTELDGLLARWDGRPAPVWRKRIHRHARGCPVCLATSAGRTSPDRLLAGLAPVVVPAALAARLGAEGATAAQVAAASGAAASAAEPAASLLGRLAQLVAAHPAASTATGALVVAGVVVPQVVEPAPEPPPVVVEAPTPTATPAPLPRTSAPAAPPTPSPTPSPSPEATGLVPAGTWWLESVQSPGLFLVDAGEAVALQPVPATDAAAREAATFVAGPGLADPSCTTFTAPDGQHLRHRELQLRVEPSDGTELFRRDATFCPEPGSADGTVTLRTSNYEYLVVHTRDDGVWVDVPDAQEEAAGEASFVLRPPPAP